MRIRTILTALGLNAVPAAGWFLADWSAGTTLLVYWFETLLGALLIGCRILLHRRVVPSKGHWDYQAPKGAAPHTSRRSTYLSAFLPPMLIFTFGHGVFLGALGGMAIANNLTPESRIDARHVLAGVLGVLLFQAIDFLTDVIWMRGRSFRWLERLGDQAFGRMIVIHLTIIGGMCAVMFTGANRDFFGVFIFLKTMLNASFVLPQYNPATPPAWLCNLMDRIKSREHDDGTTFAQFWRKTDDDEERRVARNEAPMKMPIKPTAARGRR